MKNITIEPLRLWQFETLSREAAIKHFVTDRHSNPQRNDFTLSLSSSPDREFVICNRQMVARAIGIRPDRLFLPSQVHETKIVRVHSGTPREALLDTDALITNEPGTCVAVMSADCVPILLYDKKNQAVAAVHAGWRGTVARILTLTLAEMKRVFGTTGVDLLAAIGPSASVKEYEVGMDVITAIQQAFPSAKGLIVPQSETKARVDLWKANVLQLEEFGVSAASIEISELCTIGNNEYFFSARKGDRGRFAAGIMVVDAK